MQNAFVLARSAEMRTSVLRKTGLAVLTAAAILGPEITTAGRAPRP